MERGGGGGGGAGAGGKLSRRSFRTRAPSTPYDRPAGASKPDGWFSKLLLQPASKILPSFFPPRNRQDDPPPPPEAEIEVLPELEQEDPGAGLSSISDEPGPSARYEQPEVDPKGSEPVRGKSGNTSGLAEIEQQLKQKKFSRDDTNRLIELLRLRTINLPEDDMHAAGLEDAETIPGHKHVRTSSKEEYPVHRTWKTADALQSIAHDVSNAETIPGQKNLRTPSKEECTVHRTWKTTDPFQSAAHNDGRSPVEIAKAYMGARTMPSGYDCQNGQLKNKIFFCNENSVSKLPSAPAARSPICWPGAVLPNDSEYLTPQRGRIRFGPRTPYSGGIFPKSTSKKTPRRMNSNLDDGFASVVSIRRVRAKNMTTTAPTVAAPSRINAFPFLSKTSDAFSARGNLEPSPSNGGFLNNQSTNGDDEASEFAAGSLSVHPQSSKMAKKILEHLNRTVPSPKEKSSELKLAIARTRLPPTSSTFVKDNQDDNPVISVSEEQKTDCLLGRDMVAQEGANTEKVLSEPSTSISNDKDGLRSPQTGKPTVFGLDQKTTSNSEASNSSQKTSIAAAKPSNKVHPCDNGVGFSFPVTFASNAFSEPPPTPTMTSTVAASKVLETSGRSIPSFEFGSSRSDSRLVFSFGSSSNSDTTTPVFKFGKDKPTLAFKPIGKDAFCC